jgi:hypothetical protein
LKKKQNKNDYRFISSHKLLRHWYGLSNIFIIENIQFLNNIIYVKLRSISPGYRKPYPIYVECAITEIYLLLVARNLLKYILLLFLFFFIFTHVSKRQYILSSISHVHPNIEYFFSLLRTLEKKEIRFIKIDKIWYTFLCLYQVHYWCQETNTLLISTANRGRH